MKTVFDKVRNWLAALGALIMAILGSLLVSRLKPLGEEVWMIRSCSSARKSAGARVRMNRNWPARKKRALPIGKDILKKPNPSGKKSLPAV